MEVPEGWERGFAFDPTSIGANPQGDTAQAAPLTPA
jgi:hypothetical protein